MRAERVPDHLPGGAQVFAAGGGDQDPGADDVLHGGAGVRQGGFHVREGLRGLGRVVACRHGGSVLVQRARAGQEDQPGASGRGSGVRVLGDTGQGG